MHKYKILYEFVQWANSDTELSFRNWLIAKYESMDNACNQIFCLGIHVQRWNKGDEWRIYLLFWEINISKLQPE